MGVINAIEIGEVLKRMETTAVTEQENVVYAQSLGENIRLGGVHSAIVPEMNSAFLTEYLCKLCDQFRKTPVPLFVGEMRFSRVRGLVVITSYLFH